MKTPDLDQPTSLRPQAPGRRRVLAGAGLAGAAAVAAQVLPGSAPATPQTADAAATPADTSAGYRLSAHVRRYYETARS